MPDLSHFVEAQAPVYARVLKELRAGRKTSHWIWFIFPQLTALGRSATAQFYGLDSLDDARAYAAHALLGARLRECVGIVHELNAGSALDIFGMPDTLKVRSSVTLFGRATEELLFRAVLDKYYAGEEDPLTLGLLG